MNNKEIGKSDTGLIKNLCYLGIFLLLLFIILPPLFRVLYPREDEYSEPRVPIIMELACSKTEDFGDYQVTNTIDVFYNDDKIHDSTFSYVVNPTDGELPNEGVTIEEYETLKNIPNVITSEDENTYTLKFDFETYDYSGEELLINHQRVLAVQQDYYNQNGFKCFINQIQ